MVETRGGSSSSKRSRSPSSSSNVKKPKVSKDSSPRSLPSAENLGPTNEPGNESRETELSPSNLPHSDSLKGTDVCDATLSEQSPAMVVIEGEVLTSPRPLGETAVDGEKSKVVGAVADGGSKKCSGKTSPKAAWGRLISQCSQVYIHSSLSISMFSTCFWLSVQACIVRFCKKTA